jgi:hypothetical protein
MTDAACANCRFWQRSEADRERGRCRRHAPQPANQAILFAAEAIIAVADVLARHHGVTWPEDFDAEATETSNAAMFPRTYDDDWCGDWQRGAA